MNLSRAAGFGIELARCLRRKGAHNRVTSFDRRYCVNNKRPISVGLETKGLNVPKGMRGRREIKIYGCLNAYRALVHERGEHAVSRAHIPTRKITTDLAIDPGSQKQEHTFETAVDLETIAVSWIALQSWSAGKSVKRGLPILELASWKPFGEKRAKLGDIRVFDFSQ